MDNDFGVGNKIYRVKISNIDWEITDEDAQAYAEMGQPVPELPKEIIEDIIAADDEDDLRFQIESYLKYQYEFNALAYDSEILEIR